MKTTSVLPILYFSILLSAAGPIHAQKPSAASSAPAAKPATNPVYRPFLINNLFSYFGNNGDGHYNNHTIDNEGCDYPKGSGKHLIFEDGLVWGGYHGGRVTPKVGGSIYRHGLQPGRILTDGTPSSAPDADDPLRPENRVFRVRPDVGPSASFGAEMEERLNREEVALVQHYEPVTALGIFTDYQQDWLEWPASQGAPFDDVNGNGTYDSGIDVPGVPGADQTLWYVANDCDSVLVGQLAGSPPIGLEMQRTIWGYRDRGCLDYVIFVRSRLINRSGSPIDSMFVSQWSDPDIGYDEVVGCDTTRDLGFAYDRYLIDNYNYRDSPNEVFGTRAPALGYALLHAPQVPGPGGIARTAFTSKPGWKNLRMTAFSNFTSGYQEFSDPRQGSGGDVEWFRIMKGLPAYAPYVIDPFTGWATWFAFTGDPVAGTGWIDNLYHDRRIAASSGPFTMAAGDTQEVVWAIVVGQGGDRLGGIRQMRYTTVLCRVMSEHLFRALPPRPRIHVDYPDPSRASVHISAATEPDAPSAIRAILLRADNTEAGQVDLHDDGAHGDGTGGDGTWGGTVTVQRSLAPLALSIEVTNTRAGTIRWERLFTPVTVSGTVSAALLPLFSDNLNGDGKANPGEDIRYGISVSNGCPDTLSGVFAYPDALLWPGNQLAKEMEPGAAAAMTYSSLDPNAYFAMKIPQGFGDPRLDVPLTIIDQTGNVWRDTIGIPVVPVVTIPEVRLLKRTSGLCRGDFGISILDPSVVKDHTYVVEGVDATANGTPGFTLRDLTDGRVVLANYPYPDVLGHTPVTDGFRILRGTVDTLQQAAGWTVLQGDTAWSPINGVIAPTLSLFWGTIGLPGETFWGGMKIWNSWFHSVLINFAACDGTWDPRVAPADPRYSRGYRYVYNADFTAAKPEFDQWLVNRTGMYAYQDHNFSVPFSAWDIDVSPPRRLSVGFIEYNRSTGRVDGKYWPSAASDMGGSVPMSREPFLIFPTPYSDAEDPSLKKDVWSGALPILWWGYPSRANAAGFAGDEQFLITSMHPLAAGDRWEFNPARILSADIGGAPYTYSLSQNYPNPFNPSTEIRYGLARADHVRLVVFDILGREVDVLVNGRATVGEHTVRFDASRFSSGVYFYRIESGSFVKTAKMLLIR